MGVAECEKYASTSAQALLYPGMLDPSSQDARDPLGSVQQGGSHVQDPGIQNMGILSAKMETRGSGLCLSPQSPPNTPQTAERTQSQRVVFS